MKKFTMILLIVTISVVGLSACTASKTPNEDAKPPIQEEQHDTETSLPEDSTSKTWPSSIDETIEIEANEEPITLRYFEGKSFITYVPQDMIGEPYNTEEGEAYRFYTNYQDNKNNEVYLQIMFYPNDLTEQPDILGDSVDVIEQSDRYHDWSLEEYAAKNGGLYGILGKHENQYFNIILNYLPEFSEGFVPRANKIIDHIYFTDTNKYLEKQNK